MLLTIKEKQSKLNQFLYSIIVIITWLNQN